MILATHCFNGRFLHPSPPSSSGSLRLPPLHLTNGHSSSTPCLPSLVKLSSLRPRRVRRLRVRASVQDSSLSSGVPDALDGLQYSPQSYSVRIPVGNRHVGFFLLLSLVLVLVVVVVMILCSFGWLLVSLRGIN